MKRFWCVMLCLSIIGAIFSFASVCGAANLTGTWNLEVVTAGGTGTPSFILNQDGDKVTGTYKSQWGEFDCSGTVKNDDFEIIADVSGNQFIYQGKILEDKMSGKVDLGGQASGDFTGKKLK